MSYNLNLPFSRNLIIGGDSTTNPHQIMFYGGIYMNNYTIICPGNRTSQNTQIGGADVWRIQYQIDTAGGPDFSYIHSNVSLDGKSTNSFMIVCNTANTNIQATTVARYHQWVEQNRLGPIMGKANTTDTLTLSFWVSSPNTGNHSVSFHSPAGDRSYVATYQVYANDTPQFVKITIPADNQNYSNAWYYSANNIARDGVIGKGLGVSFPLCIGSSYLTANTNQWQNGTYFAANTGNPNMMHAAGKVFKFDKVQLERGSYATPFEDLPLDVVYMLCKRYIRVMSGGSHAPLGGGILGLSGNLINGVFGYGYGYGTTNSICWHPFDVYMRVPPTVVYNGSGFYLGGYGGGAPHIGGANNFGINQTGFSCQYSLDSPINADAARFPYIGDTTSWIYCDAGLA